MKKFDLKNLQGSKRTLRSGSYATVLAVVVLAFVILVNLVVQALPNKWTEFDISTSSLFTLSDTSKNLLHELNSDVTAYYLVESGQEDTNITRLLDRYAASPQQRYEALTERCPDVLQLVPLRELASYLGVRPETLSRIRRRVR